MYIAVLWTVSVFGQNLQFDNNVTDWIRAPNCYVFTGKNENGNDVEGLYIPVKKAYDMWAKGGEFMVNDLGNYTPIPAGTAKTVVYWEDEIGLIKSVSLEGTGENAKIKVLVNKIKEGNAVITYKVNEIIYWSWHVWVTDDPTDGSTYHHGFEKDKNGNLVTNWKWMDRNLGATNAKLVGNDWYKTKGLQYEWGRKDPFPVSLITGEAGKFVPGIAQKNPIPVKFRGNLQPPDENGTAHNTGFDSPNGNIRYSINNPIHYIVPPVYMYKTGETLIDNGENTLKQNAAGTLWRRRDVTTWFSKIKLKNFDKNDHHNNVFYDLWGDTRGGKWSNYNTRDAIVAEESKRYSMKSPYDPCPCGWRVPSFYSSVSSEHQASPWGKKGSKSLTEFTPDAPNTDYPGIKVYPSLGFDLHGVSDRNLGYIPINGNYEYYPQPISVGQKPINRNSEKLFLGLYSGRGGPICVLQDQITDGGLHSSTYSIVADDVTHLGTKGLAYVCDSGNIPSHSNLGWHYLSSSTDTDGNNFDSRGVRCIKDPNNDYMPRGFETEYVLSTPTEYPLDELKSWTKDPNCYIEYTNPTLTTPNAAEKDRVIDIPLRKAYAMYKLHLSTNNDFPLGNTKSFSVVWTTDQTLISKIEIIDGSIHEAKLQVTLNENRFGNAVVAFHLGNIGWIAGNNPDPIIWSWHIWAPQTLVQTHATYTTENIANNGFKEDNSGQFINPVHSIYGVPMKTTFMDRDLGAQIPFLDQHLVGDSYTHFCYSPKYPNSEASLRALAIRSSGGLHYQWGRKDPIPVFKYPGGFYEFPNAGTARDNFPKYSVYRQTGLANGSIVYGAAIDENKYLTNYSKEYSTYSSDITASDSTYDKIKKVVTYSVANPFAYMYQSISSKAYDWLSDENGLFADRWGHTTEKSAYDPCPDGFRIPDVMSNPIDGVILFDGYHSYSEGNTPWYYNARFIQNNKSIYGIDPSNFNIYVNNEPYNVNKMNYIGGYVRATGSGRPQIRYGFVFNRPEYNIGNYPNNGIRGFNGGNTFDHLRSGIWTSAVGDPTKDQAIGMLFNVEITQNLGVDQKLFYLTPYHFFRPQVAMSCRCAKIEYDANGEEIGRYDPFKMST